MKRIRVKDLLRQRINDYINAHRVGHIRVSPKALEIIESADEFHRRRKRTKTMGAYRYGMKGDPNNTRYDRIGDAICRLYEYEQTGNQELLADVVNLIESEYCSPNHPDAHWRETDGEREHSKELE